MNAKHKEDSMTLSILETIEGKNNVTQRDLADKLGVALGLANSYLKRCVRKGLVKITQAPANRYLYYLTPKGFAEKSRLTGEYLSVSFDFYRHAGHSIVEIYQQCETNNWNKLLLCGVSELAEIASIRATEHNITIVGFWDPDCDKKDNLNYPVWTRLDEADNHDACVLTALNNTQSLYQLLKNNTVNGNILVPSILGINPDEI